MKTALGIIVKNDEEMLKKHLPIVAPCFDGVVAINFSGDPSVLSNYDPQLVSTNWPDNYSVARNMAIDLAEKRGFDWLMFLDADECMYPEDLKIVKEYMDSGENEHLVFPRIEFVLDLEHYEADPNLYPDRQGRAFRLGLGYHYRNRIHEMLYKGDENQCAWDEGHGIIIPQCPIYHYGRTKPMEQVWLKNHNYQRMARGEQPLAEFPKDHPIPNPVEFGMYKTIRPFIGHHPGLLAL